MSNQNPLTFSTREPTPTLTFHAGQDLHAKVNKKDLNEEGCLLSSETIKNIMDYHEAHPELTKLNKYNPEVQNLFAKHETPRSILFFGDKMAILYRDFSKDTVSLNVLFETEVPKNLWSLSSTRIPCLIVDNNGNPKFVLNNDRQKIPLPDDYPPALVEIINTNTGKELDSRKVILQSEKLVFEWLKSKGILKKSIEKSDGRLGAGSTTEGGVKLAQDPITKAWIAVKVLPPAGAAKTTEVAALKKLGELYGTVSVDKKYYIAGKLHHGMHLDKFLKNSPALKDLNNPRTSILLTLNIMLSLASAMQKIHDQSILQHDINPGNILVDPDRQCAHIVDFGQSRSAKSDDGRIIEEKGLITQYLQALAWHPRENLLEELVQERNKDFFWCLSYFPDKSDNFNLLPFIQRLSDALNNKSIQIPKEKMDELEALRQDYIQQIAMTPESFHSLLKEKNKENQRSFKHRRNYISEQSIEEQVKLELEKIKTNIDLENIPKTIDERKKIQAIRDNYLQAFNLIKNNRPLNSLEKQEVHDIFVKYQIIEMCDERLDQSKNLQPNL